MLSGVLGLLIMGCRPAPSAPHTVTTSLRPESCSASPAIEAEFSARDLGVQECPGIAEWRPLLVSSNERSWLELRSPSVRWSAEQAIVYDSPVGLFPGIDDAAPLEWRIDGGGTARALLFSVSAQDPDGSNARVTRLFIVRLGPQVCLLGRADSRDQALALADGNASCPT